MKFRLQFSVAVGFTILMTIVLAVAVGFFYDSNKKLAIMTARAGMADAQLRTEAALTALVAPAEHVIDATAGLLLTIPDVMQDPRGMELAATQIAGFSQFYSLFYAFPTGDFAQVMHLSPEITSFGPEKVPVPAKTDRLLRLIQQSERGRTEQLTFLGVGGERLGEVHRVSSFDPKARPWFNAALATGQIVTSPIYQFASTGRPGVTLSRRVMDEDEKHARNIRHRHATIGTLWSASRYTLALG